MKIAPRNSKRIPIACPVQDVRLSIEPILPRLLFGGPTTLQFHQPRVVEQVCLRLSTVITEELEKATHPTGDRGLSRGVLILTLPARVRKGLPCRASWSSMTVIGSEPPATASSNHFQGCGPFRTITQGRRVGGKAEILKAETLKSEGRGRRAGLCNPFRIGSNREGGKAGSSGMPPGCDRIIACEPVVGPPPATLERNTGYHLPILPGWAEVWATCQAGREGHPCASRRARKRRIRGSRIVAWGSM
jgi:hypothetical protein